MRKSRYHCRYRSRWARSVRIIRISYVYEVSVVTPVPTTSFSPFLTALTNPILFMRADSGVQQRTTCSWLGQTNKDTVWNRLPKDTRGLCSSVLYFELVRTVAFY